MKKIIISAILLVFLVSGCGNNEVKSSNVCSLYVTCEKALASESLSFEKREILPADGIILNTDSVEIFEGDSVFSVVERTLCEKKIHMQFSKTPVYDVVYIEGISNLYEKDCGDMSGWLFKVNGEIPDVAMSQKPVHNGDVIEIYYSTDFLEDM